ncbi:MAG TPA: hypothetical protein VND45_05655 [Thermoanaerobaculia bacterium]|jgi:hypothetical protein|nr:hypothetical protein [Thermoanaerobaculia bacterium]
MGRFDGWRMRGVLACSVLVALQVVAQEDPGNATATSTLTIRDEQNIMGLGTVVTLTRPTMDFRTDAGVIGTTGTINLGQLRALAVDSNDDRDWEIDFQTVASAVHVGANELKPANGAHIIGRVPVGNGYAENECTGTGTLTLTALEFNASARPGGDVVQSMGGSFSFQCRTTFGGKTGTITGEFTYERRAAGDGSDGGGDNGGEPTPPPPPPPFQILLPAELNAGPLVMANATTTTVNFDTAIDSTFSGDVQVSAVSTAPDADGIKVAVSPALFPAPGAGSGKLTITIGPSTPARSYFITLFATSGDKVSATSFLLHIDCTPPFILGINEPKPVFGAPVGTQPTLEVKPNGSGPYTYQWYRGPSGMTSNAVTGGNTPKLTLPAQESGLYWVRITNACGSVDSVAARVSP